MNSYQILLHGILVTLISFTSKSTIAQALYSDANDYVNKTFIQLNLPSGKTNGPILGSKIKINRELIETSSISKRSIETAINIHTLCNSVIDRKDFLNWTRWYQEDGNTQIFRLFKDEDNVQSDRPNAPRVEAFSDLHYTEGKWHEWSGRYTIIKIIPGINNQDGCAIFQIKFNNTYWSEQLEINPAGDLLVGRLHRDPIKIRSNIIGTSFDIVIRDNGKNYIVYLDGKKVVEDAMNRPGGSNHMRWGMYNSGSPMKGDALMFVSGATIRAGIDPNSPLPSVGPSNIFEFNTDRNNHFQFKTLKNLHQINGNPTNLSIYDLQGHFLNTISVSNNFANWNGTTFNGSKVGTGKFIATFGNNPAKSIPFSF